MENGTETTNIKDVLVRYGDDLYGMVTQSNTSMIVVFFLLTLILIVWLWLTRKRKPRYIPRPYLFTKTEWKFALALQDAIADKYLMMGKVRIADLLAVESHPKIKRSDWMGMFARISSKHIDYVLTCPDSGRVCCCLELDDNSHNRKDRIERDIFVNGAFDQAGVPLLRIPTGQQYDVETLRDSILSCALPTSLEIS